MNWSFALLCIIIDFASVSSSSFVNEIVKREVWITSLVVRTDITIHYKGRGSAENGYVFGLEEELEKDLAYISFFDPEVVKDFSSRKLPKCPNNAEGRVCWQVTVPNPEEGKLGIKMANINALEAFPKKVKLEDPFRLKFRFNSHFWSPYETKKEKTFVELAEGIRVLSIRGDCLQKGQAVICGPFAEQTANTKSDAEILFKAYKMGPLRVKEWSQEWTLLPWFNTLHTKEQLKLQNVAGELGNFDRIDLIQLAQKQDLGETIESTVLPVIPLELPRESFGLVVKDELGILWGDRVQRVVKDKLVTNITPRYPIASGWICFLSLSFYTKLIAKTGTISLYLPLGKTMVLDSPIIKFTACINLPEDAKYFSFNFLGM